MFKNAIAYLVEPGFRIDPELLQRRPARDCGSIESRTDGFTTPCLHSSNELVHSVSGYQLICLQTDDKILPGSVVAEEVAERAERLEVERGYKPGRKQMKELKELVIADLLPKAFSVKKRTYALLTSDYFIIDTSSPARAEILLDALRYALDVLPLHPIQTERHVTAAMAEWLETSECPSELSIDQSCVLESLTGNKPSISYQRTSLDTADVRFRVANGHLPKKLGLTINDRLSFVLTDSMQLLRLQQLDILKLESQELQQNSSDAAEALDADVCLMGGEIIQALNYLIETLGGVVKAEQPNDLLRSASSIARDAANDGVTDPLYSEAVTVVIAHQRASISLVQRHLRIGYNRAAFLIESMEKNHIVTPMDGQGNRTVLVKLEKAA